MILYAGNILSVGGGSIGFIETMTPKLASRYPIKSVSSIRSKPIRLLHMLFSVWRYRHVTKVVLVDTFSTQAFWFSYAVGRFCNFLKIPFIPIVRGGDFVNRLARSKKECDFLFTRSYSNIVPSRFLEFHFNKAAYSVKYIPNFIELSRYPFKLREPVNLKILWVRAFHKIYNPMLAVEVVADLNSKHVELCMVGGDTDGTQDIVKKRVSELKLEGQIKMPGRLLKNDWIKLSAEYDVFINTTTIDNMPVSVIEAMALGLPVVSTNVGGIPYLIENNKTGLLVESGSAAQMTSAILELVNNPALARELSLNARRMVEDFDWEKVSLKWFEVLDNLVTQR